MDPVLNTLILDIIGVLVTLIIGYLMYVHFWAHTYWKRRGLEYLEPKFFFGHSKSLTGQKIGFAHFFADLHKKIKDRGLKQGGAYIFSRPLFVVVDLDRIKDILVKDFQYFMDRGMYVDEENDPLTGHLFNLEGEKWRTLRHKLSPTFTSGKMKMMFQTFVSCTDGLNEILDTAINDGKPVEIKDVMARYTTDIIGSVAFGIECNSMKDPNTEFRRYGKRAFVRETLYDRLKPTIVTTVPKSILHFLGFRMNRKDISDFFMKLVKDTVEYREKNNIYRKDFMHLLLQLKNSGKVVDDEEIAEESAMKDGLNMTMNELSAQAFVFFIAGFETSSTLMTFTCYELAKHIDIQDKLRQEITTTLKKYDGKITYDAIMEMTYLDMVINESLRRHPPVTVLPRMCTKDYKIPETEVILEKGIPFFISVLALHSDPEFYPEPEKFDPERFSEENKAKRHPYCFLPFGEGPRNCIGLRFGLLQAKVGMTALLKNYRFTLNERTSEPLEIAKNSLVSAPEGDVWLDMKKLT